MSEFKSTLLTLDLLLYHTSMMPMDVAFTAQGIGNVKLDVAHILERLEAAERERDELRERLSLVRKQRDAELNKNTQLEAELARRDAAAGERVATHLVYSSVLPKFIGDTDEVESYSCFISGKTPPRKTMEEAYADAYQVCGPLYTASAPADESDKVRKLFTCSGCGAEGLDEPLESQCHCYIDGASWVEGKLYAAAQPAVLPPEMTLNGIKKFINEYTPPSEEEAALFAYNQAIADAIALGAQPQKPVAWHNYQWRETPKGWVWWLSESFAPKKKSGDGWKSIAVYLSEEPPAGAEGLPILHAANVKWEVRK